MLKVIGIIVALLLSQVSAYMVHTYHPTYRGYYRPYQNVHRYYRPYQSYYRYPRSYYKPFVYNNYYSNSRNRLDSHHKKFYDVCVFYGGGNACYNKSKKYL